MDAIARLNAALTNRYVVDREIGCGGMAIVYHAQDLKHDREVAIKVLNPELGAVLGGERFLAEIQTTAHLQHPNILPLFDSGAADGLLYYVMPFVDGETLRSRLVREGELPVREAVQIAHGTATALSYAHRRGVIHRDIKPENILLQDGQPLVADFGIALAVTNAGGARITQTGISVGTPQYMSPEQATAERKLDGRSDQYSLAAVLFEMLAGEPPFTGPSAPAILSKLITEPPPRLERRRPALPLPLAAAVNRALQKLPADRFSTVQDFADAIITDGPPALATASAIAQSATARRRAVWRVTVPSIALVAAVAAAAWVKYRPTYPRSTATPRLSVMLPDSLPLEFVGAATFGAGQPALALAPNGSSLVYVARNGARSQLALRRLDDYAVRLLPGTQDAFDPVFSPTGDRVAFVSQGQLRILDLKREVVASVTKVVDPHGIAWSGDDAILVAQDQGRELARVSLATGRTTVLAVSRPESGDFKAPVALPDGIHVLASDGFHLTVFNLKAHAVQGLSVGGPIALDSVAVNGILGSNPRYVSTGFLVFAGPDGSLFAAEFDPRAVRCTGAARLVVPRVRLEALYNSSQFSVSSSGQVAFLYGPNVNAGPLARIDRTGRIDTLAFGRVRRNTFAVSPDGRRIAAIHVPAGGARELWIYDLINGTSRQVAVAEPLGIAAEWMGDSILAVSLRTGRQSTVALLSPDRGVTVRTFPSARFVVSGVSLDGRTIVGTLYDSTHYQHAMGFSVASRVSFPLGGSTGREAIPTLSPDAKWAAFATQATGRQEVYVEPVPRTGVRYQISLAGGNEPLWLKTGELLFRNSREIWSAPLRPGASPPLGTPTRLVDLPFVDTSGRSYAATPDGKFIFFVVAAGGETTREIRFMTDLEREFRLASPSAPGTP